jgi:hypothetical protein
MSRSERTKEEKPKTPSVRLREVFFKLWEQNAEGHPWFDDFYNDKMEKLIVHYKKMIN